MDMIEVDPKLFVTCRLCLEDLGQYQIVPIVQQQIKYCYDIDVEPFDGLPQLICMKCKEVLTNYFTIKTLLCEKQSNLKSKIPKKDVAEICIQPQQDTVSSSQQTSENIEEKKKPKQKIKRIINSSESENSCSAASQMPKKKKIVEHKIKKWDGAGFKKELVCTICDVKWPQIKSLINHRRSHKKLTKLYPSIFKKTCSVSLEKVDGKANITGMNNIVVHNNRKIIENCNSFYYVSYSKDKKDLLKNSSLETASEKTLETEKSFLMEKSFPKQVDPDSSDTEEEIILRPQTRRKRRITSRSSNDTVVIESNGNKATCDSEDSKLIERKSEAPVAQISNYQCINIVDSSDSDTDGNGIDSIQRPLSEAKLGDYKIIQGIITMCAYAYQRKIEAAEKSAITETQLKRKILSIGKKNINRPGFNSTGMLKYMEHKNLEIQWAPKGIHIGKESNYIRITAKLRGPDTADDSQIWVPVPDTVPIETPDTSLSTAVSFSAENNINEVQTNMEPAIILYCNSPDPKNKLLNANPVANPKQLPRKLAPAPDLRANKIVVDPSAPFHNNEDNELCMPIITSTTSLAVPTAVECQNDNNTTLVANTNPEIPVPRIKVKPVTELMSERMLNSLREQSASVPTSNMLQSQFDNTNAVPSQFGKTNTALSPIENSNNIVLNQNVWVPQSIANTFTSQMVPQITATSQSMQLVQILNPITVAPTLTYQNLALTPTQTTNNTNAKDEFVLLNTVELPHTKTNSPFSYLKNLTRIHNLILIDPIETLSRDFVCLIKFKVQFKQEPIDEPVVLCLSLFCSKNQFCFLVRDRNQKDININKISANWQWEIIKIFRGDLVDKLLQNAQKHSQEALDYTNKFLCILKSIGFQKLS